MKTSALSAALAVLLLAPAASEAQQMKLQIQNGLVTLDAQNVSVRQILAEWARVGGTRIVNGEKVAGPPVTLQINGMPERQALDSILRGVSGYMLAGRPMASAGASAFDRILILPTSAAPRNPAPNAGFTAPRPMPAQQQMAEPVDGDEVEDVDQDGEAEPEEEEVEDVEQPQTGMNPRFQRQPGMFPNPMGPQGQPFNPQQGDGDPGGPPPTTTNNPFGVPAGATSVPGVITPVPQQDPQGQPQQRPPRPPV